MRRGFKLIVVSDAGRGVHEFHVTRGMFVAASFGLTLLVALVGIGVAGVATEVGAAPASTPARAVEAPVKEQPAEEPGVEEAQAVSPPEAATAPLLPIETEEPASACGPDMILVEGEFCPEVKHRCMRREDPEDSLLRKLRCFEYDPPAECASNAKQTMRYCIDRDEYHAAGSTLPENFQSFEDAAQTCREQGKRLCEEEEWIFACEGEEMRPYPYGFARDVELCNIDRVGLVTKTGALKDLRVARTEIPECLSPFGVHAMSGNVEEFVVRKNSDMAFRKGAYWQPGANHCRARAVRSRPDYEGMETGFRCCKDAPTGE